MIKDHLILYGDLVCRHPAAHLVLRQDPEDEPRKHRDADIYRYYRHPSGSAALLPLMTILFMMMGIVLRIWLDL